MFIFTYIYVYVYIWELDVSESHVFVSLDARVTKINRISIGRALWPHHFGVPLWTEQWVTALSAATQINRAII